LGTNYNSVLWIVLSESEGVLCPGKNPHNNGCNHKPATKVQVIGAAKI
jgi:hypothetical protein